jgi:2-amino-4-hydroxy-6-hydroxymethyldihydropteridine diphosphokinase
MKTLYLSLGSNVGDRELHLRSAIDSLRASVDIQRLSGTYETEPVGLTDQRWFLNLVLEARTEALPMQLLTRTQKIERTLGRVSTVLNGPRTIDIDILFYGNAVVRSARLEIPHPRIPERRFVLQPLAELAPELRHPVIGRTVREMLQDAPPQIVRLLHS